jgi:hypothetical protein
MMIFSLRSLIVLLATCTTAYGSPAIEITKRYSVFGNSPSQPQYCTDVYLRRFDVDFEVTESCGVKSYQRYSLKIENITGCDPKTERSNFSGFEIMASDKPYPITGTSMISPSTNSSFDLKLIADFYTYIDCNYLGECRGGKNQRKTVHVKVGIGPYSDVDIGSSTDVLSMEVRVGKVNEVFPLDPRAGFSMAYYTRSIRGAMDFLYDTSIENLTVVYNSDVYRDFYDDRWDGKINYYVQYRECPDTTSPIRSVQVSYDGVSHCERYAPYAVFGNSRDGLVSNRTVLQLGDHTITATPYQGSNCNGTVTGKTSYLIITSHPCKYSFDLYDAKTNARSRGLTDNASVITNRPCQLNFKINLSCNFNPTQVELKLFQNKSLIKNATIKSAPYFLFGNNGTDVLPGTIGAGNYSIQAIIGGIVHRRVKFTVLGTCVP